MAFPQVTQGGKAGSSLYSAVTMLPNSSLLNKIVIKCQFFFISLYLKHISVLLVSDISLILVLPCLEVARGSLFVNVFCCNRMTQNEF